MSRIFFISVLIVLPVTILSLGILINTTNRFITSLLIRLIKQTKSIDTTRLIIAALLTRQENGMGMIDDKLVEQIDIISYNQYSGWYGGDLKTDPDAQWITPNDKTVIISEFGGDALQGLHGNRDESCYEEYQKYLYQQNLLMIEKIPNIQGIRPWILMDFRSPRRVLPGIRMNLTGKD